MSSETTRYLSIDIGGTFVKYATMDGGGAILAQDKIPADTSDKDGFLATMRALRDGVDEDYAGVAVSMPGRIDTAHGIAHTGGSFLWIHDAPIASWLRDIFGKPVTIANDGKCAALAESWSGALADVDSGCVIVIGTGVGGGIVIDRHVLMGSTGAAGELSFLPTDYSTIFEPITSLSGEYPSIWAGLVSASAISRAYAKAKGIERADGVMLLDAYEVGDTDAVDVMRRFGRNMAAGIFTIQGIVDVPRFAIGGGISARPEVTDLVRDAVGELWAAHSWTPFAKPEIVTCRYGNEANLIGALAFHLQA